MLGRPGAVGTADRRQRRPRWASARRALVGGVHGRLRCCTPALYGARCTGILRSSIRREIMWIVAPAFAHDPRFMLRAALMGFEGARQRFLAQSTPGAAPGDVFVPLSEALWWAVSADDGFEDLTRVDPGYRPNVGSYRTAKGKDGYGRALRGLRYARDRCGHQRALIAIETGLTFPIAFPDAFGEFFRWRRSDQLPPPDSKSQSAGLQTEYDGVLTGRPATQALESAAKWFAGEQARARL